MLLPVYLANGVLVVENWFSVLLAFMEI